MEFCRAGLFGQSGGFLFMRRPSQRARMAHNLLIYARSWTAAFFFQLRFLVTTRSMSLYCTHELAHRTTMRIAVLDFTGGNLRAVLGLGKGAHLCANPAMVGSRQLLMHELAHRTTMRIAILDFTGGNLRAVKQSLISISTAHTKPSLRAFTLF
jgi:hypothetical protein